MAFRSATVRSPKAVHASGSETTVLSLHPSWSFDNRQRGSDARVGSAYTTSNQALPKTECETCNAIQESPNELDRTRNCGKPQECKAARSFAGQQASSEDCNPHMHGHPLERPAPMAGDQARRRGCDSKRWNGGNGGCCTVSHVFHSRSGRARDH